MGSGRVSTAILLNCEAGVWQGTDASHIHRYWSLADLGGKGQQLGWQLIQVLPDLCLQLLSSLDQVGFQLYGEGH